MASLTEGAARILHSEKEGRVFYNKVQVFNRDVSVCALHVFAERRRREALQRESPTRSPLSLSLLEALSASGLRSIRYVKEVEGIGHIVVNDVDPLAVEAIKKNLALNEIDEKVATPSCGDAKTIMYEHLERTRQFDVIDIDPYGSASEFFDAAVQSVREGGVLCVTCTDKAVLCGAWGEVAYAKYGGFALKGKICHEQAIRLVLGAITQSAARYKRYIEPLLSLSIDFYVRIFVRIRVGQSVVKNTCKKMVLVYRCLGCSHFQLQQLGKTNQSKNGTSINYTAAIHQIDQRCPHCQSMYKVGGPMWGDSLHDADFVEEMLQCSATFVPPLETLPRIHAVLNVVKRELTNPFYYAISELCQLFHFTAPKVWKIRAALIHAGYRVSDTHCLPDGIKTDAPSTALYDVFRCLALNEPDRKGHKIKDDSPGAIILSKEPSVQSNFTYVEGCDLSTKATGQVKFLHNPEANWGPKSRAGAKRKGDSSGNNDPSVKRARKPCHLFANGGQCKFAESCKFAHINNSIIIDNISSVDNSFDSPVTNSV